MDDSKPGRITTLEKRQRLDQVLECMLKGWRSAEIVNHFKEKWSCSHQNVRKYMRQVEEKVAAQHSPSREWRRKMYLERLESMFKAAVDANNQKNALDVQKEIHRLLGLYEPEDRSNDAIDVITISSKNPKAIPASCNTVNEDDNNEERR